jgi:hypothetical protein
MADPLSLRTSTFANPLIDLDCDPQDDGNMDGAMAGASARANSVHGLTAALGGAITGLMPLTSRNL